MFLINVLLNKISRKVTKNSAIFKYIRKSTPIYKYFQNYLITASSNAIVYGWFDLILIQKKKSILMCTEGGVVGCIALI